MKKTFWGLLIIWLLIPILAILYRGSLGGPCGFDSPCSSAIDGLFAKSIIFAPFWVLGLIAIIAVIAFINQKNQAKDKLQNNLTQDIKPKQFSLARIFFILFIVYALFMIFMTIKDYFFR